MSMITVGVHQFRNVYERDSKIKQNNRIGVWPFQTAVPLSKLKRIHVTVPLTISDFDKI